VTDGVRWTLRTDGSWNSPELIGGVNPQDINDDGAIVGAITVSSKNHAALLIPGQQLQDLGKVAIESWAFSVTPGGFFPILVAGTTAISNYHRGTLWRP
jgi:hypothetical protein